MTASRSAYLAVAVAVVVALAGGLAFLFFAAEDTSESPAIRGRITSLDAIRAGLGASRPAPIGSILVEGRVEADTSLDKAALTITEGTEVLRRGGGGAETGSSFADLRAGQTVEAWTTGPVRESYPVQATASRIVILE